MRTSKRPNVSAIKAAVRGREVEVVQALGITWPPHCGATHIRCPLPGHEDRNPSWRWHEKQQGWICTCGHGDILGLIKEMRGCGRAEAWGFIADVLCMKSDKPSIVQRRQRRRDSQPPAKEAIEPRLNLMLPSGRIDLALFKGIRILNAGEAVQDRSLYSNYMGYRLSIPPDDILMPTTPVVGLRAAAYWHGQDEEGRPRNLGDYPMLALGMVDRDGGVHCLRIYLAADGQEKAIILDPNTGEPTADGNRDRLEAKKLLPAKEGDNTAGRSVLWGKVDVPHWIVCEGAETGQAIAQAFKAEIEAGQITVAACISDSGLAAFQPPWACQKLTVAADRDEAVA